MRVLVAQPARATDPSTVDGVVRVLVRTQIYPGMADEFERVYMETDADLADDPASLHRWLLRSATEENVYYIMSDWTSEEGFRAFEAGATHVAHAAKLYPYRSAVRSRRCMWCTA